MKIDTERWTTQQALAVKLKVGRSAVSNWIKRGKVKTLEVPEWNVTLVSATHTVKAE